MRGLDCDGKAGGSNETEGRASARPDGARVVGGDNLVKGSSEGRAERIKPQTSDPLLFPEQSIG
jgi:hypothetical protein